MNLKFYVILLLTVVTFSLFACKDKDGGDAPCSVAWATELQDEVSNYTSAAIAYSSNPTTANCNAYKNALQAYLNAMEPYGNCATLSSTDRQSWQQAIDNAQASVDAIEC